MALAAHLWKQPEWRSRFVVALRNWNEALSSGAAPEQMRAARLLEQLCASGATNPAETPLQLIESLLGFPGHRLAVYGSLAPGKKNHHMMAGMAGTWRPAVLRGSLRNEGWGAGQGFPGFLWDGADTAIPAQVFASADLPDHWQRLDDFEGAEYRRNLVPVELESGEIEVCNVYELAEHLTTDEH